MMKFPTLTVLVACASIALSAGAPAQTKTSITARDCGATVEAELQRLGVAKGNVEEITYVEQHYSGRGIPSSFSRGVSAWVSPKSCRGKIVLEMGPNCSVYSRYTKGSCSIAGLPGY